MHKPPLSIHLLFHPASNEGRSLAEDLVPRFLSPPAVPGLQIPIFLTRDRGDNLPPLLETDDPDHLMLDAAQHTVVVILADAAMNQRIDGGTGNQWAAFTRQLLDHHDSSRHAILLVSLDDQGMQLDPTLAGRNFLTFRSDQDFATRKEEITFQLAIRALELLRGSPHYPAPPNPRRSAPVSFFLSHAKADLDDARQGPVHRVLEELSGMRVDHWYDAAQIEITEEFTDAIKQGIQNADLMLVFLTDSWAQSPWCRMEAAYAKEVGTAVLVIDALKDGEPRNFPYVGNVRVIRWAIPDEVSLRNYLGDYANHIDINERLPWLRRRACRALLSAAILETLNRVHNGCLMQGQAQPDQIPLPAPPEAVDLANYAEGTSFLYPDPPLSNEEYQILSNLRPGATFETPLMRVAQQLKREPPLTVTVSISESQDLSKHGLTSEHLTTITDEVYLYLLVAGIRIAYGGKLDPEKLDKPDNFTMRLFNLVSGYQRVAQNAGASLRPILNVAPWPLWTSYDANVKGKFGNIAELYKVPCPDLGIPASDPQLTPQENGFVVPNTPLHQYAWGPAMTAMRQLLTNQPFTLSGTGETVRTAARIVMGGKIEGYSGRYAGLIEESLLSLRHGQPLYLVGSLGGCSRLVIDLLEQRDRSEMNTVVARQNVSYYDDLVALYRKYGQEFKTREEVAVEIKSYGVNGPHAALNNGLSDEQNRELFYCIEPRRIAELILMGLSNLFGQSAGGA